MRAQLISKTKELPRDMMEAVSSIIYAAQVGAWDLRRLPGLPGRRQQFAHNRLSTRVNRYAHCPASTFSVYTLSVTEDNASVK